MVSWLLRCCVISYMVMESPSVGFFSAWVRGSYLSIRLLRSKRCPPFPEIEELVLCSYERCGEQKGVELRFFAAIVNTMLYYWRE